MLGPTHRLACSERRVVAGAAGDKYDAAAAADNVTGLDQATQAHTVALGLQQQEANPGRQVLLVNRLSCYTSRGDMQSCISYETTFARSKQLAAPVTPFCHANK
jgi:hypothetical protein